MIELIDIINEMKGKNEKGESKVAVSVDEKTLDAANAIKYGHEYIFNTPFVDILSNGNFIIVDIVFPREGAAELRTAWNYLERFGKMTHENVDGASIQLVEFTLIPLRYSGRYFCSLVNPVFWALQPSGFGKPVDSIRMLFEKEAVNIFEATPVDEKAMDREIAHELSEEQAHEEQAALNATPKEERQTLMNARHDIMK